MIDPTIPTDTIDTIDTRFRIAADAGRLVGLAVGGDGPIVPDGPALEMFDRIAELALTVGASLAHRAACRDAKAKGQPEPEPGDNVAVGAELVRILVVATDTVAGYGAAVRGDMPDLGGLLGLDLDPAA